MPQVENEKTRLLDHRLAAPMFVASLIVLGLFAFLLHSTELENGGWFVAACLIGLAIMYPVFWAETVAHAAIRSPRLKMHLWFCLVPFLRIAARDHATGESIWLPRAGWCKIDRPFERRLIRAASMPMIIVALLVLPIIAMEFFWADFVARHPQWRLTLQVTSAFIWAAFTFEFTLLVSVVKYPWAYTRRHWIDLAIILLPMITFIRAVRLTQLVRLKQITRAARIYRLRGLGLRMWRGLVALEVVEMILLRDPERRLEKLESQLEFRMEEIEFLQQDIRRLQQKIAEKEEEHQSSADLPSPPQAPTAPVVDPGE